MVYTHKLFICRFCKQTFSSSQRLSSHLNKKNPCTSFLVPEETKDEDNVIEYIEKPKDEYINPYLKDINFINSFKYNCKKDSSTKCIHCNRVFKNKKGLNYHLATCRVRENQETVDEIKMMNFIEKCKDVVNGMYLIMEQQHKKIQELESMIQQDNINKTEIIAQQTILQEKTVDALTYLQNHHKNTPKLELPHVELSESELQKYIYTNNPLFQLVKKQLLEGKSREEISMWCLDGTREKFAIKDDNKWDIEYGCKRLIDYAFNTIHNQFQKYALKRSSEINIFENTPNLDELVDLSNRVIDMHNDKAKKAFVKDACNEFHINKLFQNISE